MAGFTEIEKMSRSRTVVKSNGKFSDLRKTAQRLKQWDRHHRADRAAVRKRDREDAALKRESMGDRTKHSDRKQLERHHKGERGTERTDKRNSGRIDSSMRMMQPQVPKARP